MEHYAIKKFKHVHSCVRNSIRLYPRQRRIVLFNISTANQLQLLKQHSELLSPQRFISSPDGDRSLFLPSETPSASDQSCLDISKMSFLVIPVSVMTAPRVFYCLVSVNAIASVSINIEFHPVIGKCLVILFDVGKHHLSMSVNIVSHPSHR
jgi:hypothetical protein